MPEEIKTETPWYADHTNLAMCAGYMESQGSSISDVIYMLSKPWKFAEEYSMARHAHEVEIALPPELRQPLT